ncbi:MAG: protein translocase SEC61 complex subunit gamma [Promethearchaeota archaeon]|nr:MAG: protein translocase SEC61 complex subunit gamma [Candidatus Lokiarchaeota archaeon]
MFNLFVSNSYPKYEKYSAYDKKKKLSLYERIGLFIQNTKRIIKIANKPTRKDYFTIFKICIIGLVLLGAISYVIQLIFTVVNQALGIGYA